MRGSTSFPNLDLGALMVSERLQEPHLSSSAGASPDGERPQLSASAPLRPLRVAQLQEAHARYGTPDARRAALRAAFEQLDLDGDGVLSWRDLRVLCDTLRLDATDEEAAAVAAELARAGAATIDFEQFCALLLGQPAARGGRASSPARQRPLELPQLELDAAFRLFDMDGDGFVSIADFRAVLTAMRAPAGSVASLVAAADASGDGRLSRAEFAALLAQPPR